MKIGDDVTKIGIAKTGDELIAQARAFNDTVKALRAHGVKGDIQFLFKYRKTISAKETAAKKEERKPAGKMTEEEKLAEQQRLDDELDKYHRDNKKDEQVLAKATKKPEQRVQADQSSQKGAGREKDGEKDDIRPRVMAKPVEVSDSTDLSEPEVQENCLTKSPELVDPGSEDELAEAM